MDSQNELFGVPFPVKAIIESAMSCWNFMRNDMSLSKDERAAAERNYIQAKTILGRG